MQKQEPTVIEEVQSPTEAFFLKNKKKIIIAIGALCVIIAGYFCYRHFIALPKEKQASEALFKGEHYFNNSQYELALQGDSTGYLGFVKIASEFSGTKAGNLANAYAGICNAQLGNYEEAKKYLEKFEGKDDLISPALLATLGNVYAQFGDYDNAIKKLTDAAKKADSYALSPIYLIQAGELYEKQGKNAEAVELYNIVKEKYGNTYTGMEIDKYIERASLK